jgi:hypothetical protein
VTNYVPTTTAAVLRGTTTDSYGDPTDAATVYLSGLPAAIQEQTRRVYGDSAGQDRTIRFSACRLPYGTDVVEDDRIKDETTGVIYAIEELTANTSPVHAADVVLQLRRIT